MLSRALLITAGLVVYSLVGPLPAAAQQVPPDSLADEVRARLLRIGRAMGDSTGLVPIDSTAIRSAAAARRTAGDSTVQQLLALPGYDVTRYTGQSAAFAAETRVLTLVGAEGRHALLNREGIQLSADSALVFDEKTGRLVSVGREAVYTPDAGEAVTTRRIIYDLNENRGTAEEAVTTFAQGPGNFIVRGTFPYVNADVAYGKDVMFTSCELDEPHYHFASGEIKTIPGGTMVAKNVKLYFADVPVFWLPFIAQSTKQGRRSGLLPVRFSVNDIVRTSGSYSRRISNLGFYWAMSDYGDAQLAMDWWSGNYTALTGGFRYRWLRQFLDGRLNFRRFWQTEGGGQYALDTQHNWEVSERTRLSMNASFISSSDFLRRNSFNPQEVTQTIESTGGLNRRFDWGNLSVTGNRRQFLSDDRVITTFPQASLSLSTITLFQAPANRARFYNNMTWSASGSFDRRLEDRPDLKADEVFSPNLADLLTTNARLSSSLNLGALSVSGSADLERRTELDVPDDFYNPPDPTAPGTGSVADLLDLNGFRSSQAEGLSDFGRQQFRWNTSLNYQRTLVGSTTLTPRLSVSGRSIRADTSDVAGDRFVAAPRRLSFGADLKTDVYGFWGGVGQFDLIRHKFSPTIGYSYSPETTPTALQTALFGANAIQPINEVRIGLTQTFEGRVARPEGEQGDSAAASPSGEDGGPNRVVQQDKVTLLALRTNAVTFDFVKADSLGSTIYGFADNLRLTNQISSDFLRGMSVSLTHDVFDTRDVDAETGQGKKLDFHLQSMNFNFALNDRSSIFRWISRIAGRGGDGGETPAEEPGDDDDLADLEADGMEDATILPGLNDRQRQGERRRPMTGNVGQWSANFSYSLNRPRNEDLEATQMLQGNFRFQPSEKWSVMWRTSYDLELSRFNDHIITLQRDLHRWEADFSFRQTATGNWAFMFEVALSDNRDLHFDYEQRSVDQFR